MSNKVGLVLFLACGFLTLPFARPVVGQTMVEPFLIEAKLDEGEIRLRDHLELHPQDDEARFGLGVLQFMKSIEHLGQHMHRYGVQSERSVPMFRLPVPENEDPDDVTYDEFKDIFRTMLRDLRKADATLAKVESADVKLPLHLFQFHLDLNGNGTTGGAESIVGAVSAVMGRDIGSQAGIKDAVINFDKADVHWLRGYCHLLSAMCEVTMAYDQEAVWDVMARRFVDGAQVRFDFLMEEPISGVSLWNSSILDAIAGIHNMGLPLVDSSCLKRAHADLLKTVEQSRLMWEAIQKETDDDGEWIPNPSQTTIVSRVRFTPQMVDAWDDFLDEAEGILKGEILIPFWRGTDKTRGVNFYKVFHEPREFDLILWFHGSGAVPYLENGKVSSGETWTRFQRIFQGDFIGFAAWIN